MTCFCIMAVDLKKELVNLPDKYIILVIVSAMRYVETNVNLLKIFCNEKNLSGIYITVNRPYENISSLLDTNKVNTSNLFFIDAITKTINIASRRTEHCLYISSAESLTELSIAVSEAVKVIHGEKFLFLDSLSTLLMYNSSGTITKFAHFLTTKIREWGIKGVLVSLEKETDEKLISQLTQFVDKVIVVDSKGV